MKIESQECSFCMLQVSENTQVFYYKLELLYPG